MSLWSKIFGKDTAKLPKILIILGPTASGKTDLGLALAKRFNGEIINADSRQVYQEMNIGTAKPTGKWIDDNYLVEGVPHHLMDIITPNEEFTLSDFKTRAEAAINSILQHGKLPIIVGGTGLYVWALVDNLQIPAVAPNMELRQKLERKPLAELVEMLQKIDPESAATVDLQNPRRVLRALEVALGSGESFAVQQKKGPALYNILQIGIDLPRELLYARINDRVDKQMSDGLLNEATKLSQKYSWDLPSMSSIGYRQMGYYLRGEMKLLEAVEILKRDTRHYAKRQQTWFKRDARIHWIKNGDVVAASKTVKKFLK